MKKTIFVVALSIAGFIAVWRFEPTPLGSTAVAQPQSNVATQAPVTSTPSTPDPTTSSGESGTGSTTPTPTTTPSTSDDTVVVTTGSEESSQFGTVQVQVAFKGQQMTSIKLLQQPNSGRAVQALPQLQEEALQAQSADIDTVSGATETSESYKTSLQAAIDKRGA